MQTPGNKFVGKCNHCGAKDVVIVVINVQWPEHAKLYPGDARFTTERLCEDRCYEGWGSQLEKLGCVLDPSPGVKPFMALS